MEVPVLRAVPKEEEREFLLNGEQEMECLDHNILQLIHCTMKNGENEWEFSQKKCQLQVEEDAKKAEVAEISKECKNGDSLSNKVTDSKCEKGQCPCSYIHPPKPFKKARFAWEIKNYEFTLNRMIQNMSYHSSLMNGQSVCTKELLGFNKCKNIPLSSNYNCQNPTAQFLSKSFFDNFPTLKSLNHAHVSPAMATSYCAQYGAMMGLNLMDQIALSREEKANYLSGHLQSEPESKLIRWQTRQLCRSIFDNTVNRMLENMGFSSLSNNSHNSSPEALHPLLVLSMSEEGRGNIDQIHKKNIETQQALSVALTHKNFMPPQYHYDHTESGTNTDYESSDDDSEIGEVTHDDMCNEFTQSITSVNQNDRINAYLSIVSQNPSFGQIGAKNGFPYVAAPSVHYMCNENICHLSKKNCDFNNSCDSSNKNEILSNENTTDKSPKRDGRESSSPPAKGDTESYVLRSTISKCRSRECLSEYNENSIHKKMKVDDNENCISTTPSPEPETIIAGKVEKRVLASSDAMIAQKNDHVKSDSGDTYYMCSAIPLSVKQQGLAFQKA